MQKTVLNDSNILLSRALLGKALSIPVQDEPTKSVFCKVNHVLVVPHDTISSKCICVVALEKSDQVYNSPIAANVHLTESINARLKEASISQSCWGWAEDFLQSFNVFSIVVDTKELVQW